MCAYAKGTLCFLDLVDVKACNEDGNDLLERPVG